MRIVFFIVSFVCAKIIVCFVLLFFARKEWFNDSNRALMLFVPSEKVTTELSSAVADGA